MPNFERMERAGGEMGGKEGLPPRGEGGEGTGQSMSSHYATGKGKRKKRFDVQKLRFD